MSPRSIIIGIFALLLLSIGLFVWQHSRTETELIDYVTPPRNAAAYNRLFVLEQALQQQGHAASSHAYLGSIEASLQPGDTVVMLADSSGIAADQAAELADFVQAGGHLIARQPERSRKAAAPSLGPLLPRLGIRANPQCSDDPPCQQLLQAVDSSAELMHDATRLGLRVGQGQVDLYTSLDFLHTGRIDQERSRTGSSGFHRTGLANPVHQLQAWQLLAPNLGQGHVYLIHGQHRDRWWLRLLREGLLTWLPLALLLAGWLWARSQRLGPLLPDPEPSRRSLREHIIASANHLWRNHRGLHLYDQARAALAAQITLRAPALHGLHGVALEQALASRLQLDAQKVALALRRPAANDRKALAQRTTLLMEMRNLL